MKQARRMRAEQSVMRLHDLLEHQLATRPDKIAVRFKGVDYAYKNLAWRMQRIAARMVHQWRVRPGERIAYLGANHVDCITLLAACGRIGAIYCPLNYRLAAAELQTILREYRPVVLVADAAHLAGAQLLAAVCGATVQPIDALAELPSPRPTPAAPADNCDVMLVTTSGTTGVPKGAVHTADGMAANMRISVSAQAITADDVVLCALPMFHVGGLCIQLLPALAAGATVILQQRFDPAGWLAAVAQFRPTLALMVPATLRAAIEHPQWAATDLHCLRAVYAGSSTIPVALIEAFHARGVPVAQVYGSTETGPTSTVLPLDQAMRKIGCAGLPVAGVMLEIRQPDAHGVGEVCVRGPNLMRGYFNTQASGLDGHGWFATGDLGYVDADGALWIVGRARDMLISGGENIYPAELENVLADVPEIAEAAVIGTPDPRWGEVPVACVVRKPGVLLDEAQVLKCFEGKLARFKHPRRVVFLDALPKTAMGKVEKAKLQAGLKVITPAR